ncbi:hypothetical protein PV11_08899 [Exophiala sideris]|uniref:Uncharacterized protein n=1 Tax=Exophiala sideris TaxID=1016849 RepID=A0A0D1YQ17_9EURO|nr:hypothetical protein PV11_08899 [Exophiala sideris]
MSTSQSRNSRAMKDLVAGMDRSKDPVLNTTVMGNHDQLQAELDELLREGPRDGAEIGGPQDRSDHWKGVQRPMNRVGPWHGMSSYKSNHEGAHNGPNPKKNSEESLRVEGSKSG